MGNSAGRGPRVTCLRRLPAVVVLVTMVPGCGDAQGGGRTAPASGEQAPAGVAAPVGGQAAAPLAPLRDEAIAPYLLELDETRAVICWLSRQATVGSVVVHGPESSQTYTENTAGSRFHRVVLDGLQPGTRYRYEVGNNHTASFETTDAEPAFRVAVFGHTGGTDEPREYPTQLLANCLQALRPDVTLCTGDITYHSSIAGFRDVFFRPFSRYLAERPIHLAASNHDCGWPWLYGIDYRNVRRLFPYDYASDEGAYYHFDHKNTRFFAVSYAQQPDAFRRQVGWLTEALDASPAEFNIVFLGGQSTSYYDKDFFFEQLSRHRVDLVLGGDGGGVTQEYAHGVPFFFAGDGADRHHPFYWLQFKRYRFSVRVFDSSGAAKGDLWQFFSTREKVRVLELDARRVDAAPQVLQFEQLDQPSDSFDGLGLQVDWPFDQEVPIQVRWRPAAEQRLGGEGSFREQYLMLLPRSKQQLRLALPERDYLSGEPYRLAWLQIQLVPYIAEKMGLDVPLGDHVTGVHLFADK